MKNLKAMRSVALSLAWVLHRRQPGMSFNTCMANAWKIVKLHAALRAGPARFVFLKENGELRQAIGTLNPALLPESALAGVEKVPVPPLPAEPTGQLLLPLVFARTDKPIFLPASVSWKLAADNQDLYLLGRQLNRFESPMVIKYFDLEKNAFRSCRAERLLQVAA